MKKLFSYLSVILLLASCSSIEKYNLQVTKLHPVEDLQDDIDKVYTQLKRNHPRLYQFTPKETLDFKFDSLKKAITTPMDSRTFYKQLATVTKYVGQGHMSVSPPSKQFHKKERKKLRAMRFDITNLDFEYLDNKLFIANAIGKDSILKNAEVIKVEDETPEDLIKDYKKLIASDGYNTTLHNRVVGKRFMRFYVYDKGRFDSISLTLKNDDSTFVKKYKRRLAKDSIQIKRDSIKRDSIKIANASKSKAVLKAEKKARKAKFKAKKKFNSKYGFQPVKFMPEVKVYNRNLDFVGKDSVIALMKIRSFQDGRYKWFYDDVFKTLDSLKTETLIIDLRDNFGGRLAEIDYLYSYLTDVNYTFLNKSELNTRFPILKMLMSNSNTIATKAIAGILSPGLAVIDVLRVSKKDKKLMYRFKSAKEQEPKELNFKGKIYVLINGNSFSASSVISSKLHGDKRATFVGEETGGAYNGTVAGMYKTYELPNTKIQARIGLMHMDTSYKNNPDGYGVKPDIEILPTYQDRLNNVDPELNWILEDIEGKK
ncbi:S41 family peptidase [Olleya sp. R77988]|uniref:S41 family peptidase n=1 Tax=Olleya sp. R77988 TaxID=3093875 RepID=UPI0037C93C81